MVVPSAPTLRRRRDHSNLSPSTVTRASPAWGGVRVSLAVSPSCGQVCPASRDAVGTYAPAFHRLWRISGIKTEFGGELGFRVNFHAVAPLLTGTTGLPRAPAGTDTCVVATTRQFRCSPNASRAGRQSASTSWWFSRKMRTGSAVPARKALGGIGNGHPEVGVPGPFAGAEQFHEEQAQTHQHGGQASRCVRCCAPPAATAFQQAEWLHAR